MNNWQNEFMAEYRRQEIVREMEHIRLEEQALQSRVGRPRLFERTMFNFANWMILAGKQLRKRYEVPAIHCSDSCTGSLASR